MSAVTASTRRLWLAAGWMILGYVVLTFVGAVFETNVTLGDKPSHVASGLVSSSMTKAFTGGYIEFIAGMVFLGAAGAAALYNGHHGAPLAVVTTVNDIRNIGFSLSGGIAGVIVLAVAAAGAVTQLLPRWFSYAGYIVGVVMIAAVPAAKAGAPQTLLWYAWLVALAVLALRIPRRAAEPTHALVPASA